MIWSELARIALIGTDQTAIPKNIMDILADRGIETESVPDRVLLDGAAVFRQMRKAGFILEDFKSELPLRMEAVSNKVSCSFRSIRHLRKILGGTQQAALLEFVGLMIQNKKYFPPEFLPEIFDICLYKEDLWIIIYPHLDERAHWLLNMNPEWRSLAVVSSEVDWAQATGEDRILIFRQMHITRPEAAISLLEKEWATLNYKQKQAYLIAMSESAAPSDEAFLEVARRDKRKEVRFRAAEVLGRLPASALSERLWQEASQIIQADQKRRFRIQLPESVPSGTTDLGIDLSKSQKHFKSGLKVAWVAGLVSKIPPKRWEGLLKTTPRNIIAAFRDSHLGEELGTALRNAVLLHQNGEWAVELVRQEVSGGLPNQWPHHELRAMAQLLGPASFNEIANSFLKYNGSLLDDEHHIVARLLMVSSWAWEASLARLLIDGFRQWMSEAQVFYWNLLHYQKLLESASYCCPADLVDSFSREWPYHSPLWPRWEPAVQRFLQALSFRKEMIEELKKGS